MRTVYGKTVTEETLVSRFRVERFSRWRLLIHATARVIRLYRRFKKDEPSTSCQPTPRDVHDAERLWIAEAQKEIEMNSCKGLKPSLKDGILVVGGRTERWMQATWNKQKFVLLPKDHPVSLLIITYEHSSTGHLGVAATIAKIRSKYWIIGVSRAVKSLVSKCVQCRRLRKRLCIQEMGVLPIERLKPSPPFMHVGVDYFGPYTIRGDVQKRVRGK